MKLIENGKIELKDSKTSSYTVTYELSDDVLSGFKAYINDENDEIIIISRKLLVNDGMLEKLEDIVVDHGFNWTHVMEI